jgi:hypothetical protein
LWPLLFVATIVTALTLSCSKSESFPPAGYTVNPALTASPASVPGLNLTIAPPKGWLVIDSASLARFQLVMTNTGLSQKVFPVMPLMLYSDTAAGMMYVAKVNNRTDGLETLAGRFESYLSDRKGTGSLTVSRLAINGLNCYQFVLITGGTANYKILGESADDARFLIEYIVRAEALEALKPAVEASLATLKAGATP